MIKALIGGTAPSKKGLHLPVAMLYTASAVEGVAHECPDAIPEDVDLEEGADRAINGALAKLPPKERSAVEKAAEAGEHQPLMQAGLNDGYAVAKTKGCKAKETETLVKTVLRQFGLSR
jgi:hypothetical protein